MPLTDTDRIYPAGLPDSRRRLLELRSNSVAPASEPDAEIARPSAAPKSIEDLMRRGLREDREDRENVNSENEESRNSIKKELLKRYPEKKDFIQKYRERLEALRASRRARREKKEMDKKDKKWKRKAYGLRERPSDLRGRGVSRGLGNRERMSAPSPTPETPVSE